MQKLLYVYGLEVLIVMRRIGKLSRNIPVQILNLNPKEVSLKLLPPISKVNSTNIFISHAEFADVLLFPYVCLIHVISNTFLACVYAFLHPVLCLQNHYSLSNTGVIFKIPDIISSLSSSQSKLE